MVSSKPKRSSFLSVGRQARNLGIAGLLVVVLAVGTVPRLVSAVSCSSSADCQQQINNLNNADTQAQQSLTSLQAQASSYQDAITKYQAQIDSLQQQIDANESQQAALQQQIQQDQQQIDQKKSSLSDDIKTMYIDGQMSTIEELATSKNLSDYVDKEQYQTNVQNQLSNTIRQIAVLQQQLQQQKSQVDQLVVTEKNQNDQLTTAQNQVNQLLGYDQSQQDQFNQQIQSNKSALSQLYAQQAAIIAAAFSSNGGLHYGGTGNYPYANAVCLNSSGNCGPYSESPYNWGYPPNNPYDPLGWQYRNCTSYAFWRLAQVTGIDMYASSFPSVYAHGGEIKYSVLGDDFQNMGYTVDHNPAGSVVLAVDTAGTFGHIMYVESSSGDTANVSQYNADEDGLYSTGTISASDSSIWFIHIR